MLRNNAKRISLAILTGLLFCIAFLQIQVCFALNSPDVIINENNKLPRTGEYEFFTVNVNRPKGWRTTPETSKIETIECVLRLPVSYTTTGTPTRAVFACHGASGYILASQNRWNNNNWKEFIDTLLDAGYACFDCNVLPGTDTKVIGYALGSPLYFNVAKKAYDYIQNHYNLKHKIFVHGLSMGGVGATAFSHKIHTL